ncbi:hypothetical protein DFQ30_007931 [Apophysomyces sp. BC1015]|nr:hypothetical protein DFQ30_007931 [Apophysomyces sp. BC1015]KAG0181878.1 hypothetical protein DFQ29_006672 [Apophysomyces sp. BC1021]
MLNQQESAWAVYCAFFALLSFTLALRCRSNRLLWPFAVFSLLVFAGLVIVLTRHASEMTVDSNYWIIISPVINQLPFLSLVLFVGILETQLIFIRHLTIAVSNRNRWGSLYLQDPEKIADYGRPQQKLSSPRPWTYWANLVVLAIYTFATIAFLCVRFLQSDNPVRRQQQAVCTSIMALMAIVNAALIWIGSNLQSMKHLRMMRKNRHDVMFLRLSPILFAFSMTGAALCSWLSCGLIYTLSTPVWVVLETFVVYLPILVILSLCLFVRRLHQLGKQYPIESQHQYTIKRQKSLPEKTQSEVAKVVTKLGREASNRVIYPQPTAAPPPYRKSMAF